MFDYYISQLKNWAEMTIPMIINQENFLLIVGSFFALGVVTKWLVLHNYNKLIKKSENINKTKNSTLRQIKTKYDSLKQVNHTVENPMAFVQKSLNKCRIMYISVKRINNIINWCTLIIMAVYSIVSYEVFLETPDKITWVQYLIIGSFVAISLEMINRTLSTRDKRMELVCVLTEALEESSLRRHNVADSSDRENYNNQYNRDSVEDSENYDRTDEEKFQGEQQVVFSENRLTGEQEKEEEVLNQVIGEFLR